MVSDERRKQKKLEKKRKQERRGKEKAKEKAQERAQEEKAKAKLTFGSYAIAWPLMYRRVFFDHPPNSLSQEQIDLSGLDLHFEWYASQSNRLEGKDGEVISALRIDTCSALYRPSAIAKAHDIRSIDCSGTLTEKVAAASEYGRWGRRQLLNQFSDSGDDEYRAFPVRFTLTLQQIGKGNEGAASKVFSQVDSLPVVSGTWNVIYISFPEDLEEKINGVSRDRLLDVYYMLRIVLPRQILGSSRKKLPKSDWLAAALKAEQEERAVAEKLLPQSKQVLALVGPKLLAERDLELRYTEIKRKLGEASLSVEARTKALEELRVARPDTMDDVSYRHAIRGAQQLMFKAQGELAAAERERDACAEYLKQDFNPKTEELVTAALKEMEIATAFTHAYYRWQLAQYEIEHSEG